MNSPDVFPDEWRAMREAESQLLVRRHAFSRRDDFKEVILRALNTLPEQDAALRFLKDDVAGLGDAALAQLAPTLIDIAVDGNIDNLLVARSVLARYASHFLGSRKIIEDALDRVMDKYLSSEDEFLYRRLAELLVDIDFPDSLRQLLLACRGHDNADIAEIHGDFSRFGVEGGAGRER